jgi:gas vesicle protein
MKMTGGFTMDNESNERSVLLSVLAGIGIGVLVGAIAGLLFAPKAGTETRQDISHTLSDLGHKISDLSQQVASRVKSAVETGKHAMAEKVEKAGTEESTEATV